MAVEPEMRSRVGRERYVTEHVRRTMSRQTDRVWTRNDLAQILVDTLVDAGFDWRQPSALEEVKRLLVTVYRIAWRTLPADRLRFADGSVSAALSRVSRGISL